MVYFEERSDHKSWLWLSSVEVLCSTMSSCRGHAVSAYLWGSGNINQRLSRRVTWLSKQRGCNACTSDILSIPSAATPSHCYLLDIITLNIKMSFIYLFIHSFIYAWYVCVFGYYCGEEWSLCLGVKLTRDLWSRSRWLFTIIALFV